MKVIKIEDFCIPAKDADYDELSNFADEISALATFPIEAEPVRLGRWESVDEAEPLRYSCSRCWGLVYNPQYRYCPHCGAKMVSKMKIKKEGGEVK